MYGIIGANWTKGLCGKENWEGGANGAIWRNGMNGEGADVGKGAYGRDVGYEENGDEGNGIDDGGADGEMERMGIGWGKSGETIWRNAFGRVDVTEGMVRIGGLRCGEVNRRMRRLVEQQDL